MLPITDLQIVTFSGDIIIRKRIFELKESAPELQILIADPYSIELDAEIDIWCPDLVFIGDSVPFMPVFADSHYNLEWQINFGGGVKSVSETSDQLVFPSEEPSQKDTDGKKKPPLKSSSVEDEALDSHVGFDDDDFLDESPSAEHASVEPGSGSSILEDHDGDGKDSGYFDRLKSVFGDQ